MAELVDTYSLRLRTLPRKEEEYDRGMFAVRPLVNRAKRARWGTYQRSSKDIQQDEMRKLSYPSQRPREGE